MKVNFSKVKAYCVFRYGKDWLKNDELAKLKPGYTGVKKHSPDGRKGSSKMLKRYMRNGIKEAVRKKRLEYFKGKANDLKYLQKQGIVDSRISGIFR